MALESVAVCKAAQRNYALFSGVLISWETLGLELEGTLPSLVNLHLESETAAQYAVIAVLIYCGFRFTLERLYITPLRQFSRLERLDFFATHGLAVVALAIWTVNHAGATPEVTVVVFLSAYSLTSCLFASLHICLRMNMWVKLRRELPREWRTVLAEAMLERIEYSLFLLFIHSYIIFVFWEAIFELNAAHLHTDVYISFCLIAILTSGFISLSYQASERPWESPIHQTSLPQKQLNKDITRPTGSGSLLVLIARVTKASLARRRHS